MTTVSKCWVLMIFGKCGRLLARIYVHGSLDVRKAENLPTAAPTSFVELVEHGPVITSSSQ